MSFKIIKRCQCCGVEFVADAKNRRFCSRQCANRSLMTIRKKALQEARQAKLVEQIPEGRDFISVPEALAMYGIGKNALYRLIRFGRIPSINLGVRLIRVSRTYLNANFTLKTSQEELDRVSNIYNLAIEHCYTVEEVKSQFKVSASKIKELIRSGIPTRHINGIVYLPKRDIDDYFKTNGK